MIGLLFYLCPACAGEDCIIEQEDSLFCQKCHSTFSFFNNQIDHQGNLCTISDFYTSIRENLNLFPATSESDARWSKKAILRQGIKKMSFRDAEGHLSTIEKPVTVDTGLLQINRESMIFEGKQNRWIFPKTQILGFTTNSKYFEFKLKDKPFFQILFKEESPLKYEDLLTKWYAEKQDGPGIIEHQPRIIFDQPTPPGLMVPYEEIECKFYRERFSFPEFLLHLFIGLPLTYFLKWRANLTYQNNALIPPEGPFILLMNHESYLDPILISTLSRRHIAFFTKSTSFSDRFLQPVFRAYRALPNRRYETDPMVIRRAIRRLKKGHCIGIFPEGERTWDGKLLPFKYSTVRFLLSVQVPLVLVKIKGAFNLLPRWSHRLRSGTIRIEVLRCLSLRPGQWDVTSLKDMLESSYTITPE
jgi:1-acyl-sn-glycerol-3-phosphate acyltransferase